MKILLEVLLVCLISTRWTLAESEADADSEAEAQQYFGPGSPDSAFSPRGMWPGQARPGPQSPCELTNACCGMANQRCCVGGRRCYTVWERQCNEEDHPECLVRVEQKCYSSRVQDCRIVSEIVAESFNSSVCQPRPLRRCFSYDRKVCRPSTRSVSKTIEWTNERLVREESGRSETHCANVTTYDCENVVEQRNVSAPVRRSRLVPDQQTRCRMVQKPVGEESFVEVPVSRIVYRRLCYDMPVPQCSVAPCSFGQQCGPSQSVCSQTEFNTQTICPVNMGMAASPGQKQLCQQVREPMCQPGVGVGVGAGAGAGAGVGPGPLCGPQQQCCSMSVRRVCRQVPQRVVQSVRQPLPTQMRWEQECKTVDFNRTEIYFEQERRVVNHTERECTPVVKEECYNFTIPRFRVEQEEREDRVTLQVPQCRHEVVQDRYCHVFPDGDIECRNVTLTRPVRVNRIVCDLNTQRPFCFNIPRADCSLASNVQCTMVPRQVCQDACDESSSMCNMCANFAQGQGFGSCPASTCGNFVQLDNPFVGGNQSWAYQYPGGIVPPQGLPSDFPVVGPQVDGDGDLSADLVQDYPGGSGLYPGGDVSGSGIYPGGGAGSSAGGSGMFPGGSMGGAGMYPGGSMGGAGVYPGGAGVYPGGAGVYPGGSGVYPGGVPGGSGGLYPGGPGGSLYPGGVPSSSSSGSSGLFPNDGERSGLRSDVSESLTTSAGMAPREEEMQEA